MSLVLDALIRSSIVLTAGLGAAWILRKQPAALRHWVLAASLLLAAAQPAITQIVPSLPFLAIGWTTQEPAASDPVIETDYRVELIEPRVPAPAIETTNWSRRVFLVWAAGAAFSLAILMFGALWLSWLGAKASPASAPWREAEEEVRAQLGIRRPVRVLITRHPAMLVTWGVIAPVILLPADAAGWSADRIRLVLAHEMAHLVRRDWLIQFAAEVVRAINWFNPIFWIACARLRRESEYACDDIVLDLGIGGTSYASHLIDLARTFSVHGRTWLPAPSIARPSTLERRVRAMLNPQVNRRPVSVLRRTALAAGLLAIALPIAAASQASSTPAGTVSDSMGRPLADAMLRLTAVDSEQHFETRSDAAGQFQFPQVPAGDYMLVARSPGFASTRQRMALSGGGVTITMRLPVGTLSETVSVEGGKKILDGPRTVDERRVSTLTPSCSPNAAGEIIPPMKVRDVRPRYKQDWIDAKLEGSVLLQAKIGKDGTVRSVDSISGAHVDLEDEAIAAVSQWVFSPTYLNCEPVEVQMYVTVRFKFGQ